MKESEYHTTAQYSIRELILPSPEITKAHRITSPPKINIHHTFIGIETII